MCTTYVCEFTVFHRFALPLRFAIAFRLMLSFSSLLCFIHQLVRMSAVGTSNLAQALSILSCLPSISVAATSAPIDSLPVELLSMILHRVALSVSARDQHESPNPSRLAPLATVCKSWSAPVRTALERYVRLHSARQTMRYAKWIEERPHAAQRLIRLVRSFTQQAAYDPDMDANRML